MKYSNFKIRITFFLIFIKIGITHAQIIHTKDSVRLKSIVQVEFGGYLGIQKISPISSGFIYTNNDGYDKGLILNLITNISTRFSLSMGYRKSQQSCMIGIRNDAFLETFHLTINSNQLPLILMYNFKSKQSNYFSLLTGTAFRKVNYVTSNGYYYQFVGTTGTTSGESFINGYELEYFNWIFGISNTLKVTKKFHLKTFIEMEIYNQPLLKKNHLRISNMPTEYNTKFNQSNYRLGFSCIFN
ncbi:MAG: hypothetical protein H7296_12645 [Bacteroidia bacterium]|nr:hypothetical protein [Bacteroidia bacterium]